jgi:hypothetical protein
VRWEIWEESRSNEAVEDAQGDVVGKPASSSTHTKERDENRSWDGGARLRLTRHLGLAGSLSHCQRNSGLSRRESEKKLRGADFVGHRKDNTVIAFVAESRRERE